MSASGSSSDSAGVELGSRRRCAACKFLRRRCDPGGCVLAPYFPASQPRRYADVHAVFGTSNVTRLLQVSTVIITNNRFQLRVTLLLISSIFSTAQ